MDIGTRIKKARKNAGLTQAELAEKLGISAAGVGQWECEVRFPTIKTLERIASALGISLKSLLFEEDEACEKQQKKDSMKTFWDDDGR